MEIFRTTAELEERLKGVNSQDVGFVPTMGALHSGHISLVEQARCNNRVVVVSIFVNPTQFNDKSDLKHYPSTPEQDIAKLEAAGVDMLYMPSSFEEVYPEGEQMRSFDFGLIEQVMEGATRPGHFNGVAQVVSRLFDIVKPSRAYFGAKDFQQVAVIKAMISQMNYSVEIVECPIVRAEDGLALSSRNELLTSEHRAAAPSIYSALLKGVELSSTHSPEQVKRSVVDAINSEQLEVVYFDIVDAGSMQSVNSWSESDSVQGCVAVKAGAVRLIDNIKFR
ncbi:MAG: pantoate--beta-alanine ligase [Rikenellaceae bacterium]